MARNFNGSSGRVSVASALGVGTTFTMACWFYPANNVNNEGLMSFNRQANIDMAHTLFARGAVAGDPLTMSSLDTTSISSATSTTGFVLNTWQHACGIVDGASSRTVYLNGGGKNVETTTRAVTSLDEWNIGTRRNGGGLGFSSSWFNGNIAIPAIWNVALTDGEVLSLAQGFRPDQVRPQNLISYNLFDPRILDIKGNTWTNSTSTDSLLDPPLR